MTLLNDLGVLSGDVVLVVDDYHVIEEPHIRDGMTYLVVPRQARARHRARRRLHGQG